VIEEAVDMLSVELLKQYGADTADGLNRCMNNEGFYLRLVAMVAQDPGFSQLREALESGDLDRSFSIIHNLKGSVGNLSLTPLYRPICEMTELLRGKKEMDYAPYLREIEKQHEKLLELVKD
jgi:HPt (histidine-containing phosphotransfer) domain-containing protein